MKIRILHVDDETDIRKIAELSFGLNPEIALRSCASGKQGLAVAADWQPHLIVCDVMMPGMDGPEMLARLRACPATANIPLVFMTARAQASELEHLKSLGAAAVISKPFDPMTLAATVMTHLLAARLDAMRLADDGDGERSEAAAPVGGRRLV